ncbi:hypothetical protein DFA_02881 [Cavenderia fasciculata]|uniref:5-oxoprolinase n=1 Tax=Cavenderia fasciculata TaxID=261658 RepID=F4PIQ8_CACFS|nr:uncharacterized protein DFA_02881 [Cavenderia fasciculata]EGG24637.1 hypothetical protein DFA_02881 [Cavenderia fasciculata]|eukprot:XP_004362488.1 hypothetical protein DFA_02881 [Cavenderia fasciculata]
MTTLQEHSIQFNIDRGGTFTDIYAELPTAPYHVIEKLLSVDPSNYNDAPREGIRRIIERLSGESIPKDNVSTKYIKSIRMGTTIGTNALLERKGERVLLIITKGFKDLLQIGNQSRPNIFDLEIKKPSLIYEDVLEVDERISISELAIDPIETTSGQTNDVVKVIRAPDREKIRADLEVYRNKGINSVAIVFVHSYIFPRHEEMVGEVCREVGFQQVSISSRLMPMVKVVPRGITTCIDAYLTPKIEEYIKQFLRGFDSGIGDVEVSFMMSDGGLCPVDQFRGFRSILSGPAGGVVGYGSTTYTGTHPVIGFDMGGTSTDVSRYDGHLEHVFETEISGLAIQAPQLDITTVAAGGGSKLTFKSGLFSVGPESVGAHPGPVCYRKGGELAITDANLVLGRLLPEFFPKIFGKTQDQPLDLSASQHAFEQLSEQVNLFQRENGLDPMSVDQVAHGFIRVANEAMCRPIRNITEAKGFDCANHVLACFGGAGGQHACAIALNLGMPKVFIHRFSGILSAYGLGLASVVIEKQEPSALVYTSSNLPTFAERLDVLQAQAIADLTEKGHTKETITIERYLNLRFTGTDTAMMVAANNTDKSYEDTFKENYKREYGFLLTGRDLIVDDVRIRASATGSTLKPISVRLGTDNDKVEPSTWTMAYFTGLGRTRTPVYHLDRLLGGDKITGPAIIIDNTSTIVVEPNCNATIQPGNGNVEIEIGGGKGRQIGTELDPISLSVFSHRFMSIAEQMGRTLQRTSTSTNIKERLDFSCAIFSPLGELVANAPHIPVHLGSVGSAVTYQIETLGDAWKQGDVILTNHPQAGGSHLPDMTVITPVYAPNHTERPVFYVASRGHHADIGGITPGSMPPFSKTLEEEGVAIKSFKVVEAGEFREDKIRELFAKSRNLADNISDLKAQVAANNKGIRLMQELINSYGLDVVHAYMKHVQKNAELAVRDMLTEISVSRGMASKDTLVAEDYMDDGSPIRLALTIDRAERTAIFDFTGTGVQVHGNTNTPQSITKSAIIYALRCLVKRDIPLNQGCLDPITIIIPDNSLLSPDEHVGVVGGNVLTSQRITDIILSAFGACANSQGCMNNLTFGDEKLGYYETIAGGAGAGPTWQGCDSVQCHMTNTRATDIEVMEKRYPVIVREFSIRQGSGGQGHHRGGNGVTREIEFLKPFSVSILSERRSFQPRGLFGGENAQRGINLIIKGGNQGRIINLGAKNSINVESGDRFRIQTPGGGGYGKPN